MRYTRLELEQMSLAEVRGIAESIGLDPNRIQSKSKKEMIDAIEVDEVLSEYLPMLEKIWTKETPKSTQSNPIQQEVKEVVQEQKKVTRKCVSCGKEIPEEYMFCPHCGSKQIKTCPQCGLHDFPEDALFCPECGCKLN